MKIHEKAYNERKKIDWKQKTTKIITKILKYSP